MAVFTLRSSGLRDGDTLRADSEVEEEVVVPSEIDAPSNILVIPGQLGTGVWRAGLQARGGLDGIIYEIPYSELTCSRKLDDIGEASLTTLNSQLHTVHCDYFSTITPWEYELVLYRNNELVFAGPIIDITFTHTTITLNAQDLFTWMEKRILDVDISVLYRDYSRIFAHLFAIAIGQDPSPNIQLVTRDTGVLGSREGVGDEWRRIADEMRELTNIGLHFTTMNRTIYVFGPDERPFPDIPTLITEDFNDDLQLQLIGGDYANDIIVTGNTDGATGLVPYGRAKSWNPSDSDVYGLITQQFAEANQGSEGELDQSARRRLDEFRRPPLSPSGTFSQRAALTFDQLIPGAHVELALQVGCRVVNERYQLSDVQVTVSTNDGGSETVTPTFIPINLLTLNPSQIPDH